MLTLTTVDEVRAITDAARRAGEVVGFVPTMGALHDGHRSLLKAARHECQSVGISIFVNPPQFGPSEDFDTYPRDLSADSLIAEAEGVDWLFAPSVAEMYPDSARTSVHVADLTEGLCGVSRPNHFDGVTTVVAKLFSICGPARAYFGRKDAQQLAVVRQMVHDLDLPIEVVGCPTVRDQDGLAISSRNAGLSPNERTAAAVIPRALNAATEVIVKGDRNPDAIKQVLTEFIGAEPLAEIDYIEIVDGATLAPLDGEIARRWPDQVLLAVAVRFGATRLIDNASVVITAAGIEVVY